MKLDVNIKIVKDIPKENILKYENKTIYNCAVLTREFTKGFNAFPYLTGRLERTEISLPIEGSNLEYGLGSGVSYANYVWRKNKASWTNPSTQPQWYYSVFNKKRKTIIKEASNRALKEI